jgi:hypothetical protein
LRHALRLTAFVLVASVLALSGAFGIWRWVGDGDSVPSISQPPRTNPPTAPTSGTGAAPVARGGGTATETGPLDGDEGRAAPKVEAPDASQTPSQSARGPAPPAAGNRPRSGPSDRKNSATGRSSSGSQPNSTPPSPPPNTTVAAPKGPEPAPTAPDRNRRDVDLTALDRQAILAILHQYRQAYNAKDIHAIKQIYPTVPKDLFGRGQRDCAAFDLRFVGEPEVHFQSADTAQVNTSSIYGCIPKSKAAPTSRGPLQDAFVFKRTGDGWVIQRQLIERGE